MPIELYTGQPGNGKTALMMERLVEESKRAERPIFAAGISGLQDGLATTLEDARQWNAVKAGEVCTCNDTSVQAECTAHVVPNGSLIFVDEAWKWFGHLHDATRQQTPLHVLQLAEHRHRGLDFVWTTQQPNQLYPFVRGLIGAHTHVVRRFGTKMIDVFRWGELNEEIKSSAKRDLAQRTTRLLPSAIFGAYKSAEVHTIKPRIPWKVLALPGLVILAIALGWLAYTMLKPSAMAGKLGDKGTQSASADAAPGGSATTARRDGPRWESPTEYAKQHLPRFGTMPWTAPVFDDRSITADPMLICMSSLAGVDAQGNHKEASCTCMTEQGTAYDLDQPQCRTIAKRGPVYNPYRQQRENEQQPVQQQQAVQGGAPAPGLAGIAVGRSARTQGTFPESKQYSTKTTTPSTSLEM
ncbi:zonular occludens toxin domain-containing protein [Xanthomonas campestris pv. campestris]|uniref:zonular occludens toxin domain-containing protein n=1 Tax=Xanthomonas campestris TaxID=339 RepID=UPI0025A21A35|nr:zonular occludens toxin domain-containing protein [Xanthomonas campestris]MDM7697591.1 zonular occludens toxin domain-containing protein [Xanthomonas campestris pv. campestris]